MDACQQLEVNMETHLSSDGSSTSTDISSSFALFAHRGGCRFEMKAQNAQNELDRLARQRQQNIIGPAVGMMPIYINGCIMYVPVQNGFRPMQWP